MRLQAYTWLTADTAWVLLICGALLVYLELCRPGTVVAGAVGGACVLIALAKFHALSPGPAATGLLAAAVAALTAEAWFGAMGLAGGLLLCGAAVAAGVRWWLAAPLAIVFSSVSAALGNIAIRAHLGKRL
jgi:membrane-bound ClpP family serine protease